MLPVVFILALLAALVVTEPVAAGDGESWD